jgi:predicted NACHT family NTPase
MAAERSLKATSQGIEKAQTALTGKVLSQEKLAKNVGISRSTISKFFKGDSVDRQLFVQICQTLKLDWQEICVQNDVTSAASDQEQVGDIDALVQEVREKCKADIQQRCGTMRVLDMSQPIGLGDIYTNVNILEKLSAQNRKEIKELQEGCNLEDFDRFGLSRVIKKIPGLDAVAKHPKLTILGKPGAGKTTFLKRLAMYCIKDELKPDSVPIFISLKDFAEAENRPHLLTYIAKQFKNCGIEASTSIDVKGKVGRLCKQGRAFVLLDGLDEVKEADTKRVLKEIRDFALQYAQNQFVITCRIAAKEYIFEQFTEVEIADFDDAQIASFAENWFRPKEVKAESFIAKLDEHNPIKELATNPLLLTLLCLIFEESGNFPTNRSELYKEGLDALMKKWDAKRGIDRDWIYKDLSVQKREDMLSEIALKTFKQGDYFFKQPQVEGYIKDYIRNTLNANLDDKALQVDSEVVLKSIEAQHGLLLERAKGIYSFSHLTFHEYFTAREIINTPKPEDLEKALNDLVSRITEKRWREVFLLAVGMSSSADYLLQLMKKQCDQILADDPKLQGFLGWLQQKSNSIQSKNKSAMVRIFYFNLALTLNRNPTHDLANDLFCDLDLDLNFDIFRTLDLDLFCDRTLTRDLNLARNFEFRFTPYLTICPSLGRIEKGSEFYQMLQALNVRLPDHESPHQSHKQWWEREGKKWIDDFREILVKYRNIGHDWQFSDAQKEFFLQYYDANMLLVDCLNSDCYVSKEVRKEIEDTLLLPIAAQSKQIS